MHSVFFDINCFRFAQVVCLQSRQARVDRGPLDVSEYDRNFCQPLAADIECPSATTDI